MTIASRTLSNRLDPEERRATRGRGGGLPSPGGSAPDMVLWTDGVDWYFSDTPGDEPMGGMVIDDDGDLAIDDTLTVGLAIGVDDDGPFVVTP